MDNKKITGEMVLNEASFTMLREIDSSSVSMISELVDNSLGSLGNNIYKGKHFIEIIIKRKENREYDLIIIDNCGGIDAREIDNVMTYGDRKDYKEPFFNVFGVGLKRAAIWSGTGMQIFSKHESGGFELNFDFYEEINGKINMNSENREYSYMRNDPDINFILNPSRKVVYGTKIVFKNLIRDKDNKYNDNNLFHLENYLGWRYSKYIKNDNIEISLSELNENNDVIEDGILNHESKIVRPSAPAFENFGIFYNFLEKKYANLHLTKNDVLNFIKDKTKNEFDKVEDREFIFDLLHNELDLCIEQEFKYKDKILKEEVSLPFKIGMTTFKNIKYPTRVFNNYKEVMGISLYQADRALEHGPNLENNKKFQNRLLDNFHRQNKGSGKTWNTRIIGEINLDNYIKLVYSQNKEAESALGTIKDQFRIKDDVWIKFSDKMIEICDKVYGNFFREYNDLQKNFEVKFKEWKKIQSGENSKLDLVVESKKNEIKAPRCEDRIIEKLDGVNIVYFFEDFYSDKLISDFDIKPESDTLEIYLNKLYFNSKNISFFEDFVKLFFLKNNFISNEIKDEKDKRADWLNKKGIKWKKK
ncbi:hypothetical protein SSABA_v1c04130 [Spiroplasma sabaudiense Ar-1343]|uniref:Histidine kinase/HSP90-like ATPase domain-containing protein n=1 Tax=Spiroplasma sabaudiense Ar-1343 TaxID=1276257 RepID=W6A9V7_9MOLU|nr:ATP-binding protein [Spiroplasma sabaudiense]AHI53822.1 hypothetical protein SSABA_v1c04130 [Spiroplasma sabaudiense Ar-1343]